MLRISPNQHGYLTNYDESRRPFIIPTDGNSMIGAGSPDGSRSSLNPDNTIRSVDADLVCWDDNDCVKWVIFRPDRSVELLSANLNYATIVVWQEYTEDKNWFQIIGKVVKTYRRTFPETDF